MENEEEHQEHASFGQLIFNRTQGRARFYGSELEQDHYITMELHQSEVRNDLSKQWYYAKGQPVVRLRLTSGQFSEMITNMNVGSGVCCTIEMVKGEKIAELPYRESRKEFVHRKFEERMQMFADTIRVKKDLSKEIVKKKTLSKEDVRDLSIHLEWLTGEIERNIPFFAKCFQETMDEVVFEAKTEVENAIQHKISVLGLEKLHEQQNLLSETTHE